jgi:predicted nucleic acid-binding Zn ribbon protein
MHECPFCGNKVTDEALTCGHCGKQVCEIIRERRTRFPERKNNILFVVTLFVLVLAVLLLLEARKYLTDKVEVEGEFHDLCVKECERRVGQKQEYMEKCLAACRQMWQPQSVP